MQKNYNNSYLIGLLISQVLLAIICLVHLFAIVNYLILGPMSPYIFPVSVLAAVGLNFLFAGKLEIDKKQLLIATITSMVLLAASLVIAWFYFDLSWDGQAYHQAAVYNLSGKWNPIFQQLETPDHLNDSSILFFPKNSWLFGAAVLRLFGTVEMGKAYNVLTLFAGFGVVYALCRDFKIAAWRAVILTFLILLNPVVWSELTSYLNDGDLYLFLVMYLASVILWLRNPKPFLMLLGAMAAICLANTKFTGLVFLLVSSLFIFIFVFIKKQNRIKPFLLTHLLTGALAVFVFGFNPYVTNMLNRGNPLYPLMGSKAYPSVFATGSDDNEKWETPHNMQGKSLPVRLFYANFGRPGNAPYNKEKDAELANPFTTSPASWKAYNYQETRVSGFGPYFGILLMLTLVILPIILNRDKSSRLPVFIFFAGLCCCLFLSQHFWWPRFFPMLWLAPFVPLFLLWINRNKGLATRYVNRWPKTINAYGWVLVILFATNGLIVAFVHMQWETVSSITLRTQLQQLHNAKRPIEVDYRKFKRSMEEKLNYWDIKYTEASLKHSKEKPHKLMSVVKGYPNQVLYIQR